MRRGACRRGPHPRRVAHAKARRRWSVCQSELALPPRHWRGQPLPLRIANRLPDTNATYSTKGKCVDLSKHTHLSRHTHTPPRAQVMRGLHRAQNLAARAEHALLSSQVVTVTEASLCSACRSPIASHVFCRRVLWAAPVRVKGGGRGACVALRCCACGAGDTAHRAEALPHSEYPRLEVVERRRWEGRRGSAVLLLLLPACSLPPHGSPLILCL